MGPAVGERLDEALGFAVGAWAVGANQLAWFREGDGKLTFKRLAGDTFPWNEHVLVGAAGDTSFRISDHYPLWVEFSVRESV